MSDGITRLAIHKNLDKHLTDMGYGESIPIKDGAVNLSIQIKNGKIVQTTKEREFITEAQK
jgi:hypothetical protein